MGDCLLLSGPVRALKEEFPGFRISVLAETRFAPCFDGNPDFDEIISIDRKSDAVRLLFRRYHAIINLHGGPTSLIYSCLPWGRRIGLEHYRRRKFYNGFYNGLAPKPDSEIHTVQATLSIFQWLGLHCRQSPALRYEAHAAEAARAQQSLKGRDYAVVHPGALLPTKRWEPSRFAAVAASLQERGLTIALTCGPGEESYVGQVAKDIGPSAILLTLTIPELAELIRGAKLFVGNDSGPMHLAAAVGTPTIAIWGSSDSRRWRPWSVKHRVVQNAFECNPCPGYRCLVAETPLCIESVTIEQVNAAVEELLVESRSG
jgi:predicted lipopolysaccharide heptosyltransferase III